MNFSNSCAIDVADIKKVIISKCPLVVGIREKYVRTITPSDSTSPEHSEDCISQLQRAFNDLKENDIKTIFFYYSGHYSKADGFIIQKRKVDTVVPSKEQEYKCEHLSLSNFKDMLRSFLVQNNGKTADRKDKNFIITLDCCEAPIIRLDDSASHDDNISQLNACRPDQAAIKEPDGSGSLFKKIFIQALTMKSTNDNCFLQRDGMRCGICPFMGEDFITIGSLNTYIGRHMKEYQKLLCTEPQMPLQYASSDVKIAYLVDSTSELSFTMKFGEIQKEYKIAYHFFNNTSQLKETLFNEFMDKMLDKEKDSQLQLKVDTYKDILQIVAKTGPKDKDKHKLKLNNLAQVMSAWNGKRELYVEMREISTIEDGMVGVFNDDTEKFLSFLDECKYKKQEEPDHTTYKIDLALFVKVKDDSLKQLQVAILAYRKKEKNAELHIIRPCMRDAKGLRKMRDDFVCFKIEKVKTPLETADTESK
ncbi:uncharacterized protein LOC128550231 [Mercenaria mercenaria]|uniref:uncharacterized protein LOC128550231 n=1 Tax=Mercenaria mercenaria TaxID=6596 RepID=UPI00234EC882|nr:uncharacterized protein LOC128550231 [Mercenaria mercenaria]